MSEGKPIRVGIMGFGQTGRQIYELASRSDDVEVVAIADIGQPEILYYLLEAEVEEPQRHELQGNFLVNPRFRSRLMQIDRPLEMPWDIFAVDIVIDATGKFRERQHMEAHLERVASVCRRHHMDHVIIPDMLPLEEIMFGVLRDQGIVR